MKIRFPKFLVFALGVILLFYVTPASTSASIIDLTGKKICIDPGHGGSDPGAVNPTYGLTESMINLDVSYGLKSLLENNGAEVPPEMIKNKILRDFFDGLRVPYGDLLIDRVQTFLKAVKTLVKADFLSLKLKGR